MMVKEAIRILGAYDTNTGRTHCLCDNYYCTIVLLLSRLPQARLVVSRAFRALAVV